MDNYIIIALFALGAALGVVGLVLFRKYVAPWLQQKAQQLKEQIGQQNYFMLTEQIKTFMSAAEQQLGGGKGKAKSDLVISWIKELFPDVDAKYVQALIDGFMKPLENEGLLPKK